MTKRFRLRFTFWLDMLKEGEAAIADSIDTLKADRLFSQTIRDGIKLIMSLRDGKLDVLFELFPWVRAEFLDYMRDLQRTDENKEKQLTHTISANQNISERQSIEKEKLRLEAEQERLEAERKWQESKLQEERNNIEAKQHAIEQERKRIEAERQQTQKAMQKQLERLEELLLQQGNIPIQAIAKTTIADSSDPSSRSQERKTRNTATDGLQPIRLDRPQNRSGSQTLKVPQFSTPTFENDDEDDTLLEVKRDEEAGDIAVQNFLKSAMSLQENVQ